MVDPRRIRTISNGNDNHGPTIYWMSRDQRTRWNWALSYAQKKAIEEDVELIVAFTLAPSFLGATARHYTFMLEGLQEVGMELKKLNISLVVLKGDPPVEMARFIKHVGAGSLITDFSPLRISRKWKTDTAALTDIAMIEVDAHNIVPVWEVSRKQEYAARTIRPKINRLLEEFLIPIPDPAAMPRTIKTNASNDWIFLHSWLSADESVPPVKTIRSGQNAAGKCLESFIKNKLPQYGELRNDPNADATSNLSPYLHFGQISAQEVAWAVKKSTAPETAKQSFLEELIVRRELSDNYCLNNPDYDKYEGIPSWAKESLRIHTTDKRTHTYSQETFEKAQTHEPLWNAAQKELLRTGKIHGYMRMYWAKKILEWSTSPREAYATALALNDRWALDGRDPNGYVGIGWSIGGVHDRPWFERPIFGKIRYMNAAGCARKFNPERYISTQEEGWKKAPVPLV